MFAESYRHIHIEFFRKRLWPKVCFVSDRQINTAGLSGKEHWVNIPEPDKNAFKPEANPYKGQLRELVTLHIWKENWRKVTPLISPSDKVLQQIHNLFIVQRYKLTRRYWTLPKIWEKEKCDNRNNYPGGDKLKSLIEISALNRKWNLVA